MFIVAVKATLPLPNGARCLEGSTMNYCRAARVASKNGRGLEHKISKTLEREEVIRDVNEDYCSSASLYWSWSGKEDGWESFSLWRTLRPMSIAETSIYQYMTKVCPGISGKWWLVLGVFGLRRLNLSSLDTQRFLCGEGSDGPSILKTQFPLKNIVARASGCGAILLLQSLGS